MNLGYVSDLPDEARHNRLQQRNLRKRGVDEVEDCDEDSHEMGVGCQTEVLLLVRLIRIWPNLLFCKEKSILNLKKENNILTVEIAEMKARKVANFTEEFLKHEDNKEVLYRYVHMQHT